MTYTFGGYSVTTWAVRGGRQVWRARGGSRLAEFESPRDTPVAELARLARTALGLPDLLAEQ